MDYRTLIATNQVLNASDLSYNEMLVLGYVAEHPDVVIGAVARAVGLLPAGISRTVNTLEDKNMIERRLDPVDRRHLRLNLTKIGIQYATEILKQLEAIT